MIPVTRFDGQQVVINGDLVERIEASPDTIISLTSGRKILVRESVTDLVRLITSSRAPSGHAGADHLLPRMLAGEAA